MVELQAVRHRSRLSQRGTGAQGMTGKKAGEGFPAPAQTVEQIAN